VCAVALKTLEVVLRDRVPERADAVGTRLLERLRDIATRHQLVDEVRGRGLLIGLQLTSPRLGAGLAREYAGAVVAALLWQEHRIVTINTLNNPNVVRIEPPLVLTDEQADRVADAVEAVARAKPRRPGSDSPGRRPRPPATPPVTDWVTSSGPGGPDPLTGTGCSAGWSRPPTPPG
jgi:acetylornithine/succinyldiaminopimelate/putrescine aminotransferase